MTASAGPSSVQPPVPRRRLLRHAAGILAVLLVESVLGAGLNLYVTVPSSPSITQVFASIPLLTAHIVIAFALVAGTLYFVLVAHRSRVDGLTWRAALSCLFVLAALEQGFAFTFTANNAYSTGMLVAFLLAVVSQILVLLRIRQIPAAPAAGAAPA